MLLLNRVIHDMRIVYLWNEMVNAGLIARLVNRESILDDVLAAYDIRRRIGMNLKSRLCQPLREIFTI